MKKVISSLLLAFFCLIITTSAKITDRPKTRSHAKIDVVKKSKAKRAFNPSIGNIVLNDWGGGELYLYVPSYDVHDVVSYSWSISPYSGFEVLSAYPQYQLNVYGLYSNTNYTITITGYDANNNAVSSSVQYYHSGPWM